MLPLVNQIVNGVPERTSPVGWIVRPLEDELKVTASVLAWIVPRTSTVPDGKVTKARIREELA